MIVQRQGEWLSAKIGGELVMMSVSDGRYIGITEVGARIWELIETPKTLDEICRQLWREYDVSLETCHGEVESFVNAMSGYNAVTLSSTP